MKSKKRFRAWLVTALLLLLTLSLSSCWSMPVLEELHNASTGDAGRDALSSEELDAILSEYVKEKELNERLNNAANPDIPAGNEYNITIEAEDSSDLVAASRALLSVVSIYCKHEVVQRIPNDMFGFSYRTEATTVTSAGSGVIYQLDKAAGDAYVITNYHVVFNASAIDTVSKEITLFLYGQESTDYAIPASYVGGSLSYDIAVLRVSANDVLKKSNAVAAVFADSDRITVLDTAIAIGNPEGSGISATVGHINVESETLSMLGADNKTNVSFRVIRIDTAVNGGNSGGGLFNRNGELIGIVNAKSVEDDVDNIGFAIPSNVARNIADNILFYNDGYVHRCLLDITVASSELYTVYDTGTGRVEKRETVCVDSVSAGSIVEGKLVPGDIIRSVTVGSETYAIDHSYTVVDLMLRVRPGDKVTLHILHDGKEAAVEADFTDVTPEIAK